MALHLFSLRRWLKVSPRRPLRRPASRLQLETLEDRRLPSTFTVTNTNDSGSFAAVAQLADSSRRSP